MLNFFFTVFLRVFRYLSIIVLLAGVTAAAQAGFKINSINSTKGLAKTPVEDQLTEFESILNDPNQTITSSQLEDLKIDVSSFGGYPLSTHELAFIKERLANQNFGGTSNGLQLVLDTRLVDNSSACPSRNCGLGAADWQHERVVTDNTSSDYNQWSLITAEVIDELIGIPNYTATVLGANSAVSITDLRNDPEFQVIPNLLGASSLPNATSIKNIVNTVAGFTAEIAADPLLPTDAEYTTTQAAVNAYRGNSDASSFSIANFVACYNNTETSRSGGAQACSVSASEWQTQSTILTNFATAKQNVADNVTLTGAQLTALGLDVSMLGDPAPSWALEYLGSQLSSTAGLVSDWQTTLNGFDNATGARWKIGQVAADADNHTASDLTAGLFDAAIGAGFDTASVLTAGSSATLSAFGATAAFDNLTAPGNTASGIKSALLSYIGFSDAQYSAWNSNSDKTSFSATTFNACYASSDTLSGGASTCSLTNSQWSTLDTVLTGATDNTTASLSKANIDALFQIDNSSYSIDLSDSVNLAYAQDCIFDLNPAASGNIKSCVTSATDQVAAKWKIYQISLGTDNATHPTSDLTVALYDRAVNMSSSGFLQNLFDARPSYSLTNLRENLLDYFPDKGITDQSSDNAFKEFPVSKVGFKDNLTSYNAWLTNTGFSVSTVDNASEDIVRVWEACRRSRDTLSGGSGTCSPSYATWRSRADNRSANNIIQARFNDGNFRIYVETLMGITYNLNDVSTAYATQWQWLDSGGTSRTKVIGWTSSAGDYAFFNQSTPFNQTPPTGALLTKQ